MLKLMKNMLKSKYSNIFRSMNNLILMLENQNRYKKAEEMHQQVLKLKKTVLNSEHFFTLISRNNFTLLLESQNRYEKAEKMY